MTRRCFICLLVLSVLPSLLRAESGALEVRRIQSSSDPNLATIRVHTAQRSPYAIPANITGKFAEHLGWNIYNGMDAQILRNATFAEYPFATGEMSPDGVTKFQVEESRIVQELRRQALRFGWPEAELAELARSRTDGLACFWTRVGNSSDVQVSPDTGPEGGRAQRVQVKAAGQGVAQWTWLPLHRQRELEFEIMARSPELSSLTVSLWRAGHTDGPVASARVSAVSGQWQKFQGRLRVPADLPATEAFRFNVTADAPGQFVIRHAFLRPSDHVGGADPDIVRLLKESRLPLLRWPGGNFVSTYHWQDAVGPVEGRPTKPNFAWGGVEPNTFGTDEFIAFCRAVGCEPMICVNAGSGSPEEAARWIEYCNGTPDSPMGRVRARNGHAEPYRIRHWEVGNELWGKWQMNWTTATGYVDRFKQFAPVMLAADPSITLYSCGAPAMSGKEWNDTLVAGLGSSLGVITDHPLIGGNVAPSATPLEVYRDFMAVPETLEQKWISLRDSISKAEARPRLAVTELQLFAHLGRNADSNAPIRLTYDTLPGQGSITEAIYDILIYHAAIRLAPFVELITHSAIVNHGGGLRKERERVWANPCHYAQSAFAAMAGATPVALEIEAATEEAPLVLPDLRNATKSARFSAVDALAAVAPDGALLISLVNRAPARPIRVRVDADGKREQSSVQVELLAADQPWIGNTLEQPERVTPKRSQLAAKDGVAEIELPPCSVAFLSWR